MCAHRIEHVVVARRFNLCGQILGRPAVHDAYHPTPKGGDVRARLEPSLKVANAQHLVRIRRTAGSYTNNPRPYARRQIAPGHYFFIFGSVIRRERLAKLSRRMAPETGTCVAIATAS
jgi:hypothetical protein